MKAEDTDVWFACPLVPSFSEDKFHLIFTSFSTQPRQRPGIFHYLSDGQNHTWMLTQFLVAKAEDTDPCLLNSILGDKFYLIFTTSE